MEDPASKENENHSKQEEGKFKCKFCIKTFTLRRNCNRHEKTCSNNGNKTQTQLTCPNCLATFGRTDSLKVHVASCQKKQDLLLKDSPAFTETVKTQKRIKTPCFIQNCEYKFFHKTRLIQHLRLTHSETVTVKEPISLSFTSFEEFLKWKEEEEERTFSYFSQKSGSTALFNRYYCQHDGGSQVHSKRKTSRCNLKGRVKVGHFCIAQIKVKKNPDGSVVVVYFPTHSHKCSPQDFLHHPLPQNLLDFMTQQIREEDSPTKDFHQIKNIHTPKDFKDVQSNKVNILTKKGIRRIKEKLRIERVAQRLYEDDANYLVSSGPASSSDTDFYHIEFNEPSQEGEDTNNVTSSKYNTLLANIRRNLSTIQNFQLNAKENDVSEPTLRHVDYVLANLVQNIQNSVSSEDSREFVIRTNWDCW